MKDFIFKDACKSRFIASVGIPDRRYAKETLCAQMAINSFSRKQKRVFSRTRYKDLEYFLLHFKNPLGEDLVFFRGKKKDD